MSLLENQLHCPKCLTTYNSESKYCSNCSYNFGHQNQQPNTVKLILISVCATLVVVSIGMLSFWAGIRYKTLENNQNGNGNQIIATIANNNQSTQSSENKVIAGSPTPNVILPKNLNKSLSNANKNSEETDLSKKRTLKDIDANDWIYMSQTNDIPEGYYYYYDVATVKKYSETVQVWGRQYPYLPNIYAKKHGISKSVNYAMERLSINCKSDTFHVEEEAFFDNKGSQIPTKLKFYRWQGIAPGTITMSLKERVCADD